MVDSGITNIVIPMAGEGSRFIAKGYIKPKPLIKVRGKSLIEWSLLSLDFLNALKSYRLIFIILEEHIQKFQLDRELKKIVNDPNLILLPINGKTKGQADTVLRVKHFMNNNERLFIYNCDTYSKSNIQEVIKDFDPDGIIPCFHSNYEGYSYAKVNDKQQVLEVKEKQVISSYATTGMYYFKRGSDFVNSAESQFTQTSLNSKELYVAPLYNNLIAKGGKVMIAQSHLNWILGTPDQLSYFKKHYKIDDKH